MQNSYETLRLRIGKFVDERDWAQFHSPKNMAICLSVEASELLAHYTWTCQTGDSDAPGTGQPEKSLIADEAADVLMSLINFCHAAQVDLLSAAHSKLTDLEAKYPVELSKGSAVKNPTGA
jgi:dCTP diphosphatase